MVHSLAPKVPRLSLTMGVPSGKERGKVDKLSAIVGISPSQGEIFLVSTLSRKLFFFAINT